MTHRQRLKRLAHLTRRSHFPEVIATIVVTTTLLFAVSMIAVPETYSTSKTFSKALGFASAPAWGLTLAVTGALLGGAVAWLRAAAMWPAIVLTCVWGLWSCFMIASLPGGGLPSAAVVYGGLTWMCTALAAVYWTDETFELEKPSVRLAPGDGTATTYVGPERRVAPDPVDPAKPKPSWDRRGRGADQKDSDQGRAQSRIIPGTGRVV